MAGDAINLTALNTQGEGKDLVGMGTMENTLHEWLNTETHGLIAGPAVGREPGDGGDWANPCCGLH